MFLPNAEERDIVIFKLWPSLPYKIRLAAGICLIALGLVIQAITQSFWTGVIFLLVANALLLVSGYDNRVDFAQYDPSAEWERVDEKKLRELEQLDKKIKQWDWSLLDVSNVPGGIIFILLTGMLVLGALAFSGAVQILFIDALILLLPHWITGIRRILRLPNITIRIELIQKLIAGIRDRPGNRRIELMMLLSGGEAKVPRDIKFKVDIQGHHPDFLGLYGQVVLNSVQGKNYPYFYVVLVSKKNFDLQKACDAYSPPAGIVKELKNQDEVKVMVIRQHTTKTSGYHTKFPVATRILDQGLTVAEKVAAGN